MCINFLFIYYLINLLKNMTEMSETGEHDG